MEEQPSFQAGFVTINQRWWLVDFNQNEGMDGIFYSPTYKMLLRVLKLPLQFLFFFQAADFVAGCA